MFFRTDGFARRDPNGRDAAGTAENTGEQVALLDIERMRQPARRVALFSYRCATQRTEFR